jgi:hypothetical protein
VLKWVVAGLVFVGVGLVSFRYGHTAALLTLAALLIFVALFGGHGRRGRAEAPEAEAIVGHEVESKGADEPVGEPVGELPVELEDEPEARWANQVQDEPGREPGAGPGGAPAGPA